MHTKIPAMLLLPLPCIGQAQVTLPDHMADHLYFGPPHCANATDSAEFMQFRSGLKMVDHGLAKDTTTLHYRMAWQESQRGGMCTVAQGDGRSIRMVMDARPYIGYGMNLHFLTPDGRRGARFVHEIPCGMICRSARYHVEE